MPENSNHAAASGSIDQAQSPSVNVQSNSTGTQVGLRSGDTIVIKLPSDTKQLTDLSIYAPAIPGLIVALVGLYIAHRFSAYRDRRKELSELCSATKELADEAASSALRAWAQNVGNERLEAIQETKRKLQLLGVSATTLAARTRGRKSVDLSREVAGLRRAATADPFEEPERVPSDAQTGPIMAALADLYAKADERFLQYAGR
jgi:hypothetical protein